MKPYVICHMCTTIDGKILGDRWGKLPGCKDSATLFETTAASFGIGAWLLPILKEADVTERILRGIQHDRAQVLMPFMVRTLPAMRLLPVWAFDRLADFFGVW